MKTRIVNRTSWYYRVADGMGWNPETHDWCSLCRRVFFGVLLIIAATTFASILAGAVLYAVGDFLGWLIACVLTWSYMTPDGPAGVVMLFTGIAGICLAIIGGFKYLDKKLRYVEFSIPVYRVVPETTREFLSDWYTSFKDKYCYKVEIK